MLQPSASKFGQVAGSCEVCRIDRSRSVPEGSNCSIAPSLRILNKLATGELVFPVADLSGEEAVVSASLRELE